MTNIYTLTSPGYAELFRAFEQEDTSLFFTDATPKDPMEFLSGERMRDMAFLQLEDGYVFGMGWMHDYLLRNDGSAFAAWIAGYVHPDFRGHRQVYPNLKAAIAKWNRAHNNNIHLFAAINVDNVPSLNMVHRGFGWSQIGRKLGFGLFGGVWQDCLIFAQHHLDDALGMALADDRFVTNVFHAFKGE